METEEIQTAVEDAIKSLEDNDNFLLQNDISEWAISHKLAVHLNDKFRKFDVDCEYNGYAKADNNKKYINILRGRLEELGKINDNGDEDLIKRLIYPDIIVHKRGQDSNLLVIEIKKEKNKDTEFDREKLTRYTSQEYENHLNYQLGALIIFTTGKDENPHTIEWYQEGQQI